MLRVNLSFPVLRRQAGGDRYKRANVDSPPSARESPKFAMTRPIIAKTIMNLYFPMGKRNIETDSAC
jgi:hypothetical protein